MTSVGASADISVASTGASTVSVVPPRPRAGHGLRFRHLDAVIKRTRTTRVVDALQRNVTGTRLGQVIFRHHVCAIVRKEHGGLIVGLQPRVRLAEPEQREHLAGVSQNHRLPTRAFRGLIVRLGHTTQIVRLRDLIQVIRLRHTIQVVRLIGRRGIGTSALDGQVFRLRCTCCVLVRVRRRNSRRRFPAGLLDEVRSSFIRREERIEVCRHGVRSRLRRLRARLGVPEQRGEFIAGGGYLGIRTPAAESAGRAEQLVEPTRVGVSFR